MLNIFQRTILCKPLLANIHEDLVPLNRQTMAVKKSSNNVSPITSIGRTYLRRVNVFEIMVIKLMKGKALGKHSLHEKTAASVLLKPFISSNE